MEATNSDGTTVEVLRSCVHELKGPAGRLRTLTELLARQNPDLDEDSRTLLRYIEESAAAVGVTADALQRYAEVEMRPLGRRRIGLAACVAAAEKKMAPELIRAGATLEFSELPVVNADEYLMSWLFGELIGNALDWCRKAAPSLRVCAGYDPSTGPYISLGHDGLEADPSMAARVFRPFRMAERAGAGLGLAICRRIIERHGERIWMQPEGTEVRFSVGGMIAGDGDGPVQRAEASD